MDTGDQITVEMRLAAIEEKLDRVLAHLGLDGDAGFGVVDVPPSSMPDPNEQIARLLQAGRKIQAIKLYREATGAGLKVAKDAVENMDRAMRANGGRRR